jgi:hypothetical protein
MFKKMSEDKMIFKYFFGSLVIVSFSCEEGKYSFSVSYGEEEQPSVCASLLFEKTAFDQN